LEQAEQLWLPLPSFPPHEERRRLATGEAIVNLELGELRVRFSEDLGEVPFVWPFEFWSGRSPRHPILLGLNSIIYQNRWQFDGTPHEAGSYFMGRRLMEEALYGTFLLEDIR